MRTIRSVFPLECITIDSSLPQFYQGVASGGDKQTFRYNNKLGLSFDLDTEKRGLLGSQLIFARTIEWESAISTPS